MSWLYFGFPFSTHTGDLVTISVWASWASLRHLQAEEGMEEDEGEVNEVEEEALKATMDHKLVLAAAEALIHHQIST